MEVEQLLKQTLELSDYQILVYMSLLEKTGTAGQLLRRLNINRATLYRILDELVALSLIVKNVTGKRMFFEALHPDALLDMYKKRKIAIEEKGLLLQRVVTELISKAQKQPTDASITIEKGISAHYRYMKLQLTCKEKLIRMKVSNDSSIYTYTKYPELGDYQKFLKNFVSEAVSRGIYRRVLVSQSKPSIINQFNRTIPEDLKEARY
jgi:sugar-specific transcriptional regulator TrmB